MPSEALTPWQRVDLPVANGTLAALRTWPSSANDNKTTVLLLPGYTGSKEDFVSLIGPIASAGFRAIAVDLPGQYESPGPDSEADYHTAALGSAIADLVERLASSGGDVLLLGHSFGGLVARRAVLANAPVIGLTLLSSGPAALPPGSRRDALDAGEIVLRERGIAAAQLLNQVEPEWGGQSPQLREFLRNRFIRSSPAGLLGMGNALRTEPDLVAPLRDVLAARDIPCVVVCGEQDDVWSADTQRTMADNLGADFIALADLAHSPNTQAPQRLLAALLPLWRTWLKTD